MAVIEFVGPNETCLLVEDDAIRLVRAVRSLQGPHRPAVRDLAALLRGGGAFNLRSLSKDQRKLLSLAVESVRVRADSPVFGCLDEELAAAEEKRSGPGGA